MRDVVDQMLNDDSKDMKYRNIFINDIEPCELNQYPMQEIEQLAQNISECGLLHPITLYQKENNKYMILSGERRYRAMFFLYQNGDERFEEVPAIIKIKNLNTREIKRFLRRGNANRENLPVDLKVAIVEEALEDYYISKENKQIAPGTLKRDWLSMDTGFSARSIQNYLTIIEKKKNKEELKQTNDELDSSISAAYHAVEEKMKGRLQTKVKVDKKKMTIYFNGVDDLNRILDKLSLLEEKLE